MAEINILPKMNYKLKERKKNIFFCQSSILKNETYLKNVENPSKVKKKNFIAN